jgi:protein-arginine kinase activator protein McsA
MNQILKVQIENKSNFLYLKDHLQKLINNGHFEDAKQIAGIIKNYGRIKLRVRKSNTSRKKSGKK